MSANEGWLLLLVLLLFAGILTGIPAMLAIAGVPLLVAIIAGHVGHFNLALLNLYPARVFGVMSNTLLMAVPLFVFMGVVLERAGLAERMLRVIAKLMGGSPLGMALSVLGFSTLVAASTGIIGATIVMLVLIALKPMLEAGVRPTQAAGLIAASGTLGQIVPPSIVLVLLGDQIGNTYVDAQQRAGNFSPLAVSVGDLFAGALLPSLVLVGLYALWLIVTLGFSRPRLVTPRAEAVRFSELAFTFAPPVLLIVTVLGSILAGVATATEAAGLGAVGASLMAAFTYARGAERAVIGVAGLAAFVLVALRALGVGRAGVDTLPGLLAVFAALTLGCGTLLAAIRLIRQRLAFPAMVETIKISGMVFGIVIAASMLALVFRGFHGERIVGQIFAALPGGELGMLLVIMAVVFLLGFLLDAIEIIYIVVPLLGPVVLVGELSPVWFGVLLALNLQTSFLTPPFGFAVFYFRAAAQKNLSTIELYRGIVPFVILQLITLAIVFVFPGLATWLPERLFG